MKRIEKVRLYPTRSQEAKLQHALHLTRHLYNALLEQRIIAWKTRRLTITSREQYSQITDLRDADRRFKGLYRECEDAVLRRLDLTFRSFFRRVRRGLGGFPRFKSCKRWRTLHFPHGNRALRLDSQQKRIGVPGIGPIRLRKGRSIPPFKRAWILQKNGRWYAQFEHETPVEPLPLTGRTVGIDQGVTSLLATSDGELISNPRCMEQLRVAIERAQRKVSKRAAGSGRRKRAAARLARMHERAASQRRDHAHKISRRLVDAYDCLVLEDLNLAGMTRSAAGTKLSPGRHVFSKSQVNRRILDAGLALLTKRIIEKAEKAARTVVFVAAHYTSQTCSKCRWVDPASRVGSRFHCARCGHQEHADINAAKNILQKGRVAADGEGRCRSRPRRPVQRAIPGKHPVGAKTPGPAQRTAMVRIHPPQSLPEH